jgi:hypothetical protein
LRRSGDSDQTRQSNGAAKENRRDSIRSIFQAGRYGGGAIHFWLPDSFSHQSRLAAGSGGAPPQTAFYYGCAHLGECHTEERGQ